MAEIKPTASVKATSVQPKKSGNAISWIAPVVCIIGGYFIWRFIMGGADGFEFQFTAIRRGANRPLPPGNAPSECAGANRLGGPAVRLGRNQLSFALPAGNDGLQGGRF